MSGNYFFIMNHERHGLKYLDFSKRIIRPEYSIWVAIKQRCLNPKCKAFHNYGGRGIKICDRWKDSFKNFFDDMGSRPSIFHSIDREENDGDYYKGNCRWVLKKVQDNNKRTNVRLSYKGEYHTITEWALKIGINVDTLHKRLSAGWSVEKSLSHPHRFKIKPKRIRSYSRWNK